MNYVSNPKSAVIFTGGKGTRMVASGGYEGLKPLTEVNGRPFLSWLLQYLEGQKIEKFFLLGGAKIQELYEFSQNTEYCVEVIDTGIESGTAQRLVLAEEKILSNISCGSFVLTYGDSIANFSVANAIELMSGKVLKDKHNFGMAYYDLPINYGVPEIKSGSVTRFFEKEWRCPINAGFYILDASIFSWLGKDVSFESDTIPKLVSSPNINLCAYNVTRWQGMDQKSDIEKLEKTLIEIGLQ
jgi:D-glycero-alpha-D-manno-heptose 1-phosphate guanylyltransferase